MAERTHRIVVGVMGAGSCDGVAAALAERVGRLIADRGAVLLCGGRGGVMEAAARGARSGGGLVVGIMPGRDASETPPNPSIVTSRPSRASTSSTSERSRVKRPPPNS